jgi:hypothetical protein
MTLCENDVRKEISQSLYFINTDFSYCFFIYFNYKVYIIENKYSISPIFYMNHISPQVGITGQINK